MVTLQDIRASIPRECFQIKPIESWLTLIRCLIVVVASQSILFFIPNEGLIAAILLPIAWLLSGLGFVGLFVLGHDCAHQSFSNNSQVNWLVGHFSFAFLLTGYENWRVSHNFHHAHTQIIGVDPDWPEKMVTRPQWVRLPRHKALEVLLAFATPVGLMFGFIVGMIRRTFMATLMPQIPLSKSTKRMLIFSNVFMLSVGSGTIYFLVTYGGWWIFIKHFAIPAYIGMMTGALLTLMHHSQPDSPYYSQDEWDPMRGQVHATYDIRFPRFFEWLWLDINIHIPHHVAPKIPWYHLKEASAAIKQHFPELHKEREFTLWNLIELWRRPFLEYDSASRLFRPTKN
jgi:omega-6 fatty acid desaturase (delta-12 desaturase)